MSQFYVSPLFADNNECNAQNSACGSRASCVNTPGSFNCECSKGFSLDNTGVECEGEQAQLTFERPVYAPWKVLLMLNGLS